MENVSVDFAKTERGDLGIVITVPAGIEVEIREIADLLIKKAEAFVQSK